MNTIKSKDAERVANCAVGNGSHIPSMMLVFMLLLQSATAGSPTPCTRMRYTQDENMLRQRVRGTVFEPGALLHLPGLRSPDQCISQMELIFKDLSGDGMCRTAKPPWRTIRARVRRQAEALHSLQRPWAHEILRGQEDGPMGPRARSAQEMAQAWAYLGMQRAAGKSHRGLDHLLQPGFGRNKHMATATALPSPYRPGTTTDPDLQFAAYTMAVWEPYIGPWREQQRLLLTGLVEALQPMTEAMRRHMPESVKRVAVKKNPALIASFTVLIRRPDRQVALEYIKGHQIAGHAESSGVFRARGGGEILEAELQKGYLGDEAVTFIDKMMSRPPRKDSEDIVKLMAAETKKGYQSTPVKKAEVDKKYGVGKWRPMPLFINEESGRSNGSSPMLKEAATTLGHLMRRPSS